MQYPAIDSYFAIEQDWPVEFIEQLKDYVAKGGEEECEAVYFILLFSQKWTDPIVNKIFRMVTPSMMSLNQAFSFIQSEERSRATISKKKDSKGFKAAIAAAAAFHWSSSIKETFAKTNGFVSWNALVSEN